MADGSVPAVTKAGKKGWRGMLDAVQTLLARSSWASGAGLMFEGQRDLYTVLGYPKVLTPEHFLSKYNRGGIAKRVVEAPVDATWSDPPIITGSSRFKKEWDNLVTRHRLFYQFRRLDVLVGLGSYAILLVGYDDGRALDQPVKQGVRKIMYLQPYGEAGVTITGFEDNTSSERYGLPTMYEVDPGEVRTQTQAVNTSSQRKMIKVHWSRILHVSENANENPIIGHSRLEAVYNYLNDLEKIAGGSAEAYWLVANRGLHINVDKEMDLEDGDEEALSEEVDEYQHGIRRVIRTRGTEVNSLGAEVTDPRGTFNVAINLISGTTGIPQRILLGSEAGQLASEQDRSNWANRVQERVANYGGPILLLPFIEMQIRNGALPIPSEMTVDWPDAFKLSPLERGQASAQMARSVANVIKALATPVANDGSGRAEEETQVQTTTPGQATTDPVTGKVTKGQPTTTMTPTKKYKPSHTLLDTDEARSIVGFGKHAPIFDDAQDADPSTKPSINEGGDDEDPIVPRPRGLRTCWSITVKYGEQS